MKYVKTFEDYKLNEVKGGYTTTSKADELFNRVDNALKGNQFYVADLGNKVYMKDGGKRPVAIEKYRKQFWITDEQDYQETTDLGDSIKFYYNFNEYIVSKRNVQEMSKEEYLEHKLERIIKQMNNNLDQDQSADWDAAAAHGNMRGRNISSEDVDPRIDAGFAMAFAKKYKINIKKFWDSQRYTTSWSDFEKWATKYPFK